MIQNRFQNIDIDCWIEEKVKLSATRPCLCMRGELPAIETLIAAAQEVCKAGLGSRRTLTLLSKHPQGFVKLQLRFVEDKTETLRFAPVDDGLIIEFSEELVRSLTMDLRAWADGQEDFCIHPVGCDESLDLWLWRDQRP